MKYPKVTIILADESTTVSKQFYDSVDRHIKERLPTLLRGEPLQPFDLFDHKFLEKMSEEQRELAMNCAESVALMSEKDARRAADPMQKYLYLEPVLLFIVREFSGWQDVPRE